MWRVMDKPKRLEKLEAYWQDYTATGVACFPPVARVAQHQECAQHHDPPLGYDGIKDEEFSDEEWNNILRVACPECHYPFDGDGWVLCKEHRDETHP